MKTPCMSIKTKQQQLIQNNKYKHSNNNTNTYYFMPQTKQQQRERDNLIPLLTKNNTISPWNLKTTISGYLLSIKIKHTTHTLSQEIKTQ